MNKEEKIWYLKRLKLFEGGKAREQLHALNKIAHHRQYKKNQTIFFPGDRTRSVYLLKKGHVKLCRISPNGRSIIVAILEPGEIFGEIDSISNSPTTTIAEGLGTLDAVTVCEIQHDDFERYLRQFPEIAIRVIKLVGAKTKQLESRIEDLAFLSVPSRLAKQILDLSVKYGEVSSLGIRINLRLTHQILGDLVGANRETITGIIGEWRRAGIIARKGGYTYLLDRRRLTQIL